jgi:hypothetical protein
VGYFGVNLDAALRKTGAAVTTRAVCASAPRSWREGLTHSCGWFFRDPEGKPDRELGTKPKKTPLIAPVLAAARPTLVIVALAANLTGAPTGYIESETAPFAELAASAAAGGRCVWVGPPRRRNEAGQKELYETLQRSVTAHCRLIDSREFTRYPAAGGDGVHYWGAEGARISQEWAAAVFNRLGLHSSPDASP